ncbi:MAG: c-type cytochrome, partial [Myxococcota bacterium]
MKHSIVLLALLSSSPAWAASGADDERPQVGDVINGKKLYDKECGACHGDNGTGGRSGVALSDSGRMNLLRDDQLFAIVKSGAGVKKEPNHKFEGKLSYLETWDVVAYMNTLHLEIGQFFPDATHYVAKDYEIDEHGLKRIENAIGKRPEDKKASVFTFFKKAGTDSMLEYVPQDPIKLDHLKKKEKIGYLVFLPLKTVG